MGFIVTAMIVAGLASITPWPQPKLPPLAVPTPTPAIGTNIPAFNLNAHSIEDPASPWVIVNKHRPLPIEYHPADLVKPGVHSRFDPRLEQTHLRADAARALEQLFASAETTGYHLTFISGYRSGSHQQLIYTNSLRAYGAATTDEAVARPGYSEHQTGWAADIGRRDGACELQVCFGGQPEGRWLQQHAHEYGFIIRYGHSQEALTGYHYEPWHLRYIGLPLAKMLHQNGQTMEQYFGLSAAANYN